MAKSVPGSTAPATYSVNGSAQNADSTGAGNANVTVMPPAPPLTVTLSVPKTTYPTNATVTMTATVLQGAVPASGASVMFTLTRPDGTTTRTVTTGSNGQATWSYKVSPKGPKGTYQVKAQATSGSQSATASPITFTVQ
ncbi:MAG: hypothetical protein DMG13_24755 [Acidobacteria bacterium]|nr:MAG: hypothetical protein DMG13_24755 [Acidobacteriota bacterium]